MPYETESSSSLDWPPGDFLNGRVGTCMRVLKGEDRIGWLRVELGSEEVLLLLAADGHGGKVAAELCYEAALRYIVDECKGDPSSASLQGAFTRAFTRLDADVRAVTGTAGSTLTVVAVNESRGELTVANAGDSSAVLVEAASEQTLTTEHRIQDSADERERVIQMGAKVARAQNSSGEPACPMRAWPGGLAVCRTIGDADCFVASPVPDVSVYHFDVHLGAAVVACSDGVWDAVSLEKVREAEQRRESGGG